MAKTKTTAIAYLLIITTVIVPAALPRVDAQPPSPTTGHSSAPPPGPDCFDALANLADCLSFVDDGSNLTKPDPACCPEVADLIKTQPICLCELLGNSSQFGFSIDTNRAIKLPSLCHVDAPPVSLCKAVGVPVTTSAPSPSEAARPTPGLSSNQHLLVGLALVLFTSFSLIPHYVIH